MIVYSLSPKLINVYMSSTSYYFIEEVIASEGIFLHIAFWVPVNTIEYIFGNLNIRFCVIFS